MKKNNNFSEFGHPNGREHKEILKTENNIMPKLRGRVSAPTVVRSSHRPQTGSGRIKEGLAGGLKGFKDVSRRWEGGFKGVLGALGAPFRAVYSWGASLLNFGGNVAVLAVLAVLVFVPALFVVGWALSPQYAFFAVLIIFCAFVGVCFFVLRGGSPEGTLEEVKRFLKNVGGLFSLLFSFVWALLSLLFTFGLGLVDLVCGSKLALVSFAACLVGVLILSVFLPYNKAKKITRTYLAWIAVGAICFGCFGMSFAAYSGMKDEGILGKEFKEKIKNEITDIKKLFKNEK